MSRLHRGPDVESGSLRLDPRRLIDITRPLGPETLAWPGAVPLDSSSSRDGGWRVTTLRMTSHTGTHMDAPAHLLDDGATIDGLPLSRLVLPATVAECRGDSVAAEDLRGLEVDGRAVLLRTDGGRLPRDHFRAEYPHLKPEAAKALRDGGARLVGVDYLSVDPPGGDVAHRLLLEAGVPIVEDLLLGGVAAGEYVLVCLPLRIHRGDGAPVRAFLSPL